MNLGFSEIVGNEKIKRELQESINNKIISHSYMFVGQEGIGKKEFAKEFAKAILCLNQNKPCNECSSCIKFNSSNNPDFTIIEPDGNSIKIAQTREMQEKVYRKPIISDKKVFIINDSEKMTEEAQNALLKTLEEPPEYMVIILVCSNENKILSTIKSRCLKIKFNNITDEEIRKFIKKEQPMKELNENLLAMCNGSIGRLMKINQDLDIYTEIENSTNNLIYGRIKNAVQALNQFEILYKSKDIINNVLDYITTIIFKYINDNKDYRSKFLNTISIIESTKKRLMSNTNYDMSIDNLVLKIWEEINEGSSRS